MLTAAMPGPGRAATAARHRARRFLVQGLYQWQLAGGDPDDVRAQFIHGRNMGRADVDYFDAVMRAIPRDVEAIDAEIAPLLERSPALVDPVERAILWLACYELRARPEVPARVVIDEAVELAKRFGAEQGHRFVNGIVDRLAHALRPHELGRAAPPGG